MKSLAEINSILRRHKRCLATEYKVKRIGVFGSYAHERATSTSDIDILVEFSEPIGWEFFDLQDYLEEILGLNVDLVTVNALRPSMRDSILDETVYA